MIQILSFTRCFCCIALLFAVSGCGGETSVQKAPEGSDIQQYLAEHPEILEEDSLDAAAEAEMEE